MAITNVFRKPNAIETLEDPALAAANIDDDFDAIFDAIGQIVTYVNTAVGDVVGPAAATDNAIARYDSTTGKLIQDSGITIADGAVGTLAGSNSGDVTLAGTPDYITLAGQIITRALINLTTHVTNRLPFANLVAATAASRLLGRGSAAGAGNVEELTLGTGLTMTGTVLSSSGGADEAFVMMTSGI